MITPSNARGVTCRQQGGSCSSVSDCQGKARGELDAAENKKNIFSFAWCGPLLEERPLADS